LVSKSSSSSNRNVEAHEPPRQRFELEASEHYRIAVAIFFGGSLYMQQSGPLKSIPRIAKLTAHAFGFRRNHDPLVIAAACFRIAGLARAKSVSVRNSQVSSRLR
jgi:hypothetical protein